jgi:hypothetical protein
MIEGSSKKASKTLNFISSLSARRIYYKSMCQNSQLQVGIYAPYIISKDSNFLINVTCFFVWVWNNQVLGIYPYVSIIQFLLFIPPKKRLELYKLTCFRAFPATLCILTNEKAQIFYFIYYFFNTNFKIFYILFSIFLKYYFLELPRNRTKNYI